MIITHEKYDQAMTRLQYLYDHYGSLKEYQRGFCIRGPSGTGKTFIMETFASRYQPIENEEATIRPVVWVSIRRPNIDAVLITLLSAFGLQNLYSKKPIALIDTLIACIHNSQTRLLGFDEASQIAEHRADKTVRPSADLLKTLINETAASVVCFGVDSLKMLPQINDQFRERFSREIYTHSWGIRKEKTISEFTTYVMKYAESKNITIPQTNAGVNLITDILYATDGRQRKIHDLIDTLCELFPDRNGENLQLQFLEAFKVFSNSDHPMRNPFHTDFNNQELIFPGELYGPETLKL